MPLKRVGPDPNGLYFQAVSTAEWSSSYGDQLRAQGYRYCGYGTWGIYVAGPGEPCYTHAEPEPPPGPQILPPAPDQPAPESPGPTGPVSDHACGGCGRPFDPTKPPLTPAPGGGAPASAPGTMTTEKVRTLTANIPWWAWVLLMLAGAQAVRRG